MDTYSPIDHSEPLPPYETLFVIQTKGGHEESITLMTLSETRGGKYASGKIHIPDAIGVPYRCDRCLISIG